MKRFYWKERCRFHVQTDLSISSVFVDLTVAKGHREKSEQVEKEEVEEASFKKDRQILLFGA